FSSRRRHTRFSRDWSSDVCSSDLDLLGGTGDRAEQIGRDLVEIAPMLLGDGEGVALVGRIDVHEGERRLVFVKLEARDGARDDRSEERRVGKECTARESATRCRKK